MLPQLTAVQRAALSGPTTPGFEEGDLPDILDGLIGAQVEDSGRRAINVLRLAANVASTETITIGSDVFEINIVNTDTTEDVSGGELATGTPDISHITIAAHGLVVGDLIRVENEIMKVLGVVSVDKVTVRRGHSGTTKATHANGTDIFKAGTPATGSRIEVGLVTTLTPAAAGAALAAVINGESTHPVTAVVISDNELLIVGDTPGALTLACTETLGGGNNAFAAAAMYGGRAAGQRHLSLQSRAPTATEVALGTLHFLFAFTPTLVQVRVVVAATPGVAKAWDGAITISGGRVTLGNGGDTDWAATDIVQVLVTD